MSASDNQLRTRWSKREKDLVCSAPHKGDAGMLLSALTSPRLVIDIQTLKPKEDPSILAELEARGYDPSTLRIFIRRKPDAPQDSR